MIKGAKKYKTKDLPIAATFISSVKEHKFILVSAEFDIGPNNEVRRKEDTGLTIAFEENQFICFNTEIVNMLLNNRNFQATRHGFDINPLDPTGFWRAQGAVEEEIVTTFKLGEIKPIQTGKIDPEKLLGIDPEKLVKLIPVSPI